MGNASCHQTTTYNSKGNATLFFLASFLPDCFQTFSLFWALPPGPTLLLITLFSSFWAALPRVSMFFGVYIIHSYGNDSHGKWPHPSVQPPQGPNSVFDFHETIAYNWAQNELKDCSLFSLGPEVSSHLHPLQVVCFLETSLASFTSGSGPLPLN